MTTSITPAPDQATQDQASRRFDTRPSDHALFDMAQTGVGWTIESGSVDLFLVSSDASQSSGARTHILRIEEGETCFSTGPFPSAEYRLLAIPTPHTRVQSFNPRSLAETHASHIDAQLEAWVTQIAEAVSEQPATGILEFARPGRNLTTDATPKSVLPRKGVVWVQQVAGSSRFLSDQNSRVAGRDFLFPLSKRGWLLLDPSSRLECAESATPDNLPARLAGLAQFHHCALLALAAKLQRVQAKEEARLSAKRIADAAGLNSSLFQLGATLNPELDAKAAAPAFSDPLMEVCDRIGKASGIALRPHPDMLKGIKLADPMSAIARASGIRVRRVALRGEWWTQNNGSLVAFRDTDNAPLGLLPKRQGGYTLYDPSAAEQSIELTQALAAELNPFAFLFYRPFPSRAMGLFDIVRFGLFQSARDVWMVLLMGIAAGLMSVITPYATSIIFNDLIPGAEKTLLIQMAAFLAAIALSTTLFSLTRSFAVLRIEGKMDSALQSALWDRLLRLPASFFRDYSSGDLALRSLGIAQIRRTLTGTTLTAIFSSIFSVFSFALLFYYSRQLAMLATALVGIAFLVSLAIGWVQVSWQRELFGVRGFISSLLLQLITGVAKFRVAAAESRAFMAWTRVFTRQKKLYTKIRSTTNGLMIFSAVYPVLALAAIFFYNAQLLADPNAEHINTGDFIGFITAFTQFLATTLMVSSALIAALSVVPVYERARPIFQALPEVDEARSDPGVLTGEIDITNVSFRYREDMPPVLRGISISIKPGQFVAFVGVSGSGKSTLLRLLLGFENPEAGAIYFDGRDLSGLDVQSVRRQLGVVLQTSRLISGDIFTNIVGSSQLTIDDAWAAARMSGLEVDIKRMPMGMHTIIGEGGGGISGGQRQRLMIARAIVAKPRILIFDEATSALDNETQGIVSRSLEGLQATRIVIAHRLSTIVHADQIYVLANGLVAQSGTYDQLLEQGGLFADLVKRQIA